MASRLRFLTIEQIAEELNVGLPTVRMLLKSGELRGIQIGGHGLWRVAALNLERFIAEAYRLTSLKFEEGQNEEGRPQQIKAILNK